MSILHIPRLRTRKVINNKFNTPSCIQKTHIHSSLKTKALRNGLVNANPCSPTTASSSYAASPSDKRVDVEKKNKKNREK